MRAQHAQIPDLNQMGVHPVGAVRSGGAAIGRASMTRSAPHATFKKQSPLDNLCCVFFTRISAIPNANIWQAMLTLLMRQSNGDQSQICDLFPQSWLSDRTRIFYIRWMLKHGILAPLTTGLHIQTEIGLTVETTETLRTILGSERE